jgi:hypothetical protein
MGNVMFVLSVKEIKINLNQLCISPSTEFNAGHFQAVINLHISYSITNFSMNVCLAYNFFLTSRIREMRSTTSVSDKGHLLMSSPTLITGDPSIALFPSTEKCL